MYRGCDLFAPPLYRLQNENVYFVLSTIRYWQVVLTLALQYIVTSLRKNRAPAAVGISTVLMVVFYISTIFNVSGRAPDLFQRIAERITGETDFILTPNGKSGTFSLVNQTYIDERLANHGFVKGTAPRWLLTGSIRNSVNEESVDVIYVVANTTREKEFGLGRSWNKQHRPLGKQEMHCSSTALKHIHLPPNSGRTAFVSFDLKQFLIDNELVKVTKLGQIDEGAMMSVIQASLGQVGKTFVQLDTPIVVDLESLTKIIGLSLQYPWGIPSTIRIKESQFEDMLELLNVADNGILNSTIANPLYDLTKIFPQIPVNSQNIIQSGLIIGDEVLVTYNVTTFRDLIQVAFNGRKYLDIPRDSIFSLFNIGPGSTLSSLPFLSGTNIVSITPREIMNLPLEDSDGYVNRTVLGALLESILDLQMEYTVVDEIDAADGKWTPAFGNVCILDSTVLIHSVLGSLCWDSYLDMLHRFVPNVTMPSLKSIEASIPLDDYALMSIVNFADRRQVYTTSGTIQRAEKIVHDTNKLFLELGIQYPLDGIAPIDAAMIGTDFLQLFTDQVLNGTVMIMVLLTSILMHSLFVFNTQEKMFEHGMMRALGLPLHSLWVVLITQAIAWGIPGTILGITMAAVLGIGTEYFLSFITAYPPKIPSLTTEAFYIPIGMGLVLPLLANIVPVRAALGRTLRDSLDVYHQTFSETFVTRRLENVGLRPWMFVLGSLMTFSGFLVYYLVPLSFVFQNFVLFFATMNFILMGMLGGLAAISQTLQPWAETASMYTLMWWKDRRLMGLVKKNLAGHRRNTSTVYLMFTISIASIVFGGMTFTLQSSTLLQNVELAIGADIHILKVQASRVHWPDNLVPWFDENQRSGLIKGHTFLTEPLSDETGVLESRLSDLLGFASTTANLYGVPENFLDITYSQYVIVAFLSDSLHDKSLKTEWGTVDYVKLMFKYWEGTVETRLQEQPPRTTTDPKDLLALPATLSTSLRGYVGNVNTYFQFRFVMLVMEMIRPKLQPLFEHTYVTPLVVANTFSAQPIAFVTKTPGLLASSYTIAAPIAPVLIPLTAYSYMKDMFGQQIIGKIREYGYTPLNNPNPVSYETNGTVCRSGFLRFDSRCIYAPRQWVIDPAEVTVENTLKKNWDPTIGHYFIRFNDNTTEQQRKEFVNTLRSMLDSKTFIVFDALSLMGNTRMAANSLLSFFYFVAFLQISMDFCMLWVSFSSNIINNSWEFGVLRSIGLSTKEAMRAYIYEAVILVLSAFTMGTIVGGLVGLTLTAQLNVFFELPLVIDLPWALFFISLGLALSAAVLGSYLPAKRLKKISIASVIKGKT